MKKIRRIATLMLAIIMAASTAVIPSYAESDIQYSESDLHELIDYDMAVDAGHVNRLNDEEDMNTLIFANEDNTKTMYFYGEDIKYTDEFGVIRDKTNKLTSTATGYTNADNDISIHLPNTLSDGITIDYEDISLMLIPATSELPDHIEADDVATSRGEADYVVYDDVFGAKTSLKYTPMYSGLKEDIILDEYTGVSEFQFLLYTGGLELDEVDNEYVLLDGEDTVAKLSQVFIYDSEYNTAVGSMIVTPIKDDQIYAITVCADVDFLTASSTVYPVTVDPTITINYSNVNIHDASINGYFGTTNYGSDTTLSVGGTYSSYAAIKFLGLYYNSVFSSLDESQIYDATLNLRCISKGTSNPTVYVSQYLPSSSTSGYWDESRITYNSNGVSFDTTGQVSETISSTGPQSFNITDIVKSWRDSSTLIEEGLLLRLSNYSSSSYSANFASSEHTTPYYRPNIEITYICDGIYSISQGSYTIGLENNYAIDGSVLYGDRDITDENDDIDDNNDIAMLFRFIYNSSDNTYTIYSLTHKNGYGRYVTANNIAANQNLILHNSKAANNKFFIYKENEGYSIRPKANTYLALTLSTGTHKPIILSSCSSSASSNQVWQLTWSDKNAEYAYYLSLGFSMPVDTISYNSRYGVRDHNGLGDHLAFDFIKMDNDYATNVATGTVITVGREVVPNPDGSYSGMGNYVIVKTDYKAYGDSSKSIYIIYGHLGVGDSHDAPLSTATTLKPGHRVLKNENIGYIGNTGGSDGAHLHIAYFILSDATVAEGWCSYGSLDYINTIDPRAFYDDGGSAF